MNLEDYNEYYIQGSDHYLIPKDVFEELFNEMVNWRDESQKQKEVKLKETKIKILEAEIEQLYEFIAKIQHLGEIEQQRLVNLENKGEK